MEPRYLHLRPDDAPPNLPIAPYRVVIISDQEVGDGWRGRVADWIVAVGSLYLVAWGVDCEKWHDSVDWAVLEVFDFGEIPDDRFVMTTWHNDEPLSGAFWYAGNCAIHPDVELSETIILHVAAEARCAAMLQTYRDSQVMADNA